MVSYPVPITYDLGRLVDRVDWYLKTVYPVLMAISMGCILGVRNLAGLGTAPMPVLGAPN